MRTFERAEALRGFTLVELLITITIIGLLAGIVMGGLTSARQAAREAATKATIAKLHNIIMERYESYLTRRVPVSTKGLSPKQAAELRLAAIRDLMRMEMPERWTDVTAVPTTLPCSVPAMQRPALCQAYLQQYNNKPPVSDPQDLQKYKDSAKCLYMIVAADAENMEQFSRSEIDVDSDGWPMFVDGWGMPICFLRWAPAFNSPHSDIQSGDAQNDHDPFDPRAVEIVPGDKSLTPIAFRLIPLVFSAGRDKHYGINMGPTAKYTGNPTLFNDTTEYVQHGAPIVEAGLLNTHFDNVHNHHIEQR